MARWFALLEAAPPPPEWAAALAPLAALTGGTVDERPHLTVGTGEGDAPSTTVVAAFSGLPRPDVLVRARPPVTHQAGAHLHFGWTFAIAVEKDEALRDWYTRLNAALESVRLRPPGTADAERWGAHVTTIRGTSSLPPPTPELRTEVVQRLEACLPRLTFRATAIRVTRLEDGTFSTVALLST